MPARPAAHSPLLWRDDPGPVVDRAAALAHLAAADPDLGRAIRLVGPLDLEPPDLRSPFHYLQRAIIYQQLSGKAAGTIFGRFRRIYSPGGRRNPTPDQVLATPEATLRSAGLSTAKSKAIIDLAAHAQKGTVPSRRDLASLEPEAIIERLVQVRGVGRWTVEMLLIFHLGHPDVLPLGDLGIRKGFGRVFGVKRLPSPRTVARRGERWRPYRSIASWYLWRVLDLGLP